MKKSLSIILALTMCLSGFLFTVSAETTEENIDLGGGISGILSEIY